MTTKSRLYLGVAALAIAVVLTGSVVEVSAQQSAPPAVAIDNDDIGGVVTGASGPEAGVWVIAETTDLPTRYAKMVVTDDQGRYVVPDLPKAKYKVWVRGYGLVDSAKVDGEPGKQLNLRAVPAQNEAEAAKSYPAIYWYSMLKIPDASQFGKKDGDIPDKVKQTDWLNLMKNNGCVGCHQMGQVSTRTFPPGLGEFSTHSEAWVTTHPGGTVGRAHGEHPGGPALPVRRSSTLRIGPSASPRANCRKASRRDRKGSSATSWSRPGTGATRRSICTT